MPVRLRNLVLRLFAIRWSRRMRRGWRTIHLDPLEVRLLLSSHGPFAVDDQYAFDSLMQPDLQTVDWDGVGLDVLRNDSSPDGRLNFRTLTITSQPAHGHAVVIQEHLSEHFLQFYGFSGLVDDNSSPVGDGRASAVSGTVDPYGEIKLAVSSPLNRFEYGVRPLDEEGDYRLFVRLGPDGFSAFESDRYDFIFDSRLSAPVDMPSFTNDFTPESGRPWFQHFRMENLTPGMPYIAWIDNTVGHGTPDTVLQKVGPYLIRYEPEPGFLGTDTIGYTVRDTLGHESNEATVQVTIRNRAPVAEVVLVNTPRDTETELTPNASDPDGTINPASLRILSDPSFGTIEWRQRLSDDGTEAPYAVYVPSPGYSGPDQLMYSVEDNLGAVTSVAEFRIQVTNATPWAMDDTVRVTRNGSVRIDVLGNDGDSDGFLAPASLMVTQTPEHGTAVIEQTAMGPQVKYTPQVGYLGPDSLTYTIQDNDGAAATAMVMINPAPVAGNDPGSGEDEITTQENTAIAIDVLTNDFATVADGVLVPASLRIIAAPRRGNVVWRLTDAGWRLTYTPAPGTPSKLVVDNSSDSDDGRTAPGQLSLREAIRLANADGYTDTFTYTVQDSFGVTSSPATVTVNVNPAATVISFAPQLLQRSMRRLTLAEAGDTSHGNSALVISSPVSILGPTTGNLLTLAGLGIREDLRHFLVTSTGQLTLKHLKLTQGGTDYDGGALYVQSGGSAMLHNSHLAGNQAHDKGGAIFSLGSLSLTDSVLRENQGRQGGGISSFGPLTVTKTQLIGNSAQVGGALDHEFGTATILDSKFLNNTATETGGGVFNASKMQLMQSVFSGNRASDGGGLLNFGVVAIEASVLDGNKAVLGGGLMNGSAPPTVSGSPEDAGTVFLKQTTIKGNTAEQGGGVYNLGDIVMDEGRTIGNSATQGGAFYNDDQAFRRTGLSQLLLTGVTVADNRATDGGGIYNKLGGVTLKNTTLSGNSATQAGGGIYSLAYASLENTTLSQNSASRGGGVCNGTGSLTIDHSTIAGNAASQGGGVFNEAGYVALNNSIIANNGIAQRSSDIAGRTPVDAANSSKNVIGTGGSGGLADGQQGNQIPRNPLLGPLGNYGGPVSTMPLLPGSPAIDAGNGEGPDARGVGSIGPRDTGAYESRGFTIQALSGSLQSAVVQRGFAKPLIIRVIPNHASEPVAGGVVKLVAPDSFASASLTPHMPILDRNGKASVRATANGVAGRYVVTARVSGAANAANFVLTNTALAPNRPQTSTTLVSQAAGTSPGTGAQVTGPASAVSKPLRHSEALTTAASSLDWSATYATLPTDTTEYRLNERGQLWRRLPGGVWTLLIAEVQKFEKALNGDLYVLTQAEELRRLQLGVYWSTLHTGVRTFEMGPDGQVFALDRVQQLTTFTSLDRYYVLPAMGATPPGALDLPTTGEVIEALGIARLSPEGCTWGFGPPLSGEHQHFELQPDMPFQNELSALLDIAPPTPEPTPECPESPPTSDTPRKWYNSIRIVMEPLADAVESPRFFAGIGWLELHRARYRVQVYGVDQHLDHGRNDALLQLFVDHDHLHLVDPVPEPHVRPTSALIEVSDSAATRIGDHMLANQSLLSGLAGSATVSHVKGTGIQESSMPKLLKGADGTIYKVGVMDHYLPDAWGTVHADPSPANVWRLVPGNNWERLHELLSVELSPDGTLYGLTPRGELQSLRPDTRQWSTLTRNVQSFAMTADGTVVALQVDRTLRLWSASSQQWQTLHGDVREFAVLSDGRVYALTEGGQFRRLPIGGHWTTVVSDVSSLIQLDNTLYTLTRQGTLRRLSVGTPLQWVDSGIQSLTARIDGTLYVVQANGTLLRWTPEGRRESLIRGVRSCQVDPVTGHLYVLLQSGNLKRLKYGDSWSHLHAGVASFSIDKHGTAYVLDEFNRVTMYASRFETSLMSALDPDGPPIPQVPPSGYEVTTAAGFGGIFGGTSHVPDNVFNDIEYFAPGTNPNWFHDRIKGQSAWNNVRWTAEPVVNHLDPPRAFPDLGVGYAQLRHEIWKITIYGSTLIAHPASDPDDFYVNESEIQVLYVDQDVLFVYPPGVRQRLPEDFGNRPENPFDTATVDTELTRSFQASFSAVAAAASPNVQAAAAGISVQRRRDELAQSLTAAPDGTLYKLGGGQTGLPAVGSEPGPYFLWRLPPNGEWQPIDHVYSFEVDDDSRLYFVDKDRLLRTPKTDPSDYAVEATDVLEFTIDRNGRQWMLNGDHELRFRQSRSSAWSAAENGIQAVLRTPSGQMFTITDRREFRQWSGDRWLILERRVQSWAMLTDGTLLTLNIDGRLWRRAEGRQPQILRDGIADLQVALDGRVFALSSRNEVLQLTPRDHWTVLYRNIRLFRIAPNGDLYAIDTHQELSRLKVGQSWVRLQADVAFMEITSDGTVTATNSQGIATLYSSLGVYFLGALVSDEHPLVGSELPTGGAVMAAANLVSPTQAFTRKPLHPLGLEHEGAGINTARMGSLFTTTATSPALLRSSVQFKIPPQRVVSNVAILTEKIEDTLENARHDSRLGVAKSHRVQYRSTIWFTNEQGQQETLILFLDHDHEHDFEDL